MLTDAVVACLSVLHGLLSNRYAWHAQMFFCEGIDVFVIDKCVGCCQVSFPMKSMCLLGQEYLVSYVFNEYSVLGCCEELILIACGRILLVFEPGIGIVNQVSSILCQEHVEFSTP